MAFRELLDDAIQQIPHEQAELVRLTLQGFEPEEIAELGKMSTTDPESEVAEAVAAFAKICRLLQGTNLMISNPERLPTCAGMLPFAQQWQGPEERMQAQAGAMAHTEVCRTCARERAALLEYWAPL